VLRLKEKLTNKRYLEISLAMLQHQTQVENAANARRILCCTALLCSLALSGCTAILSPIDSIPAERVPRQFLAEPQADKVNIDVSRLRQSKPEFYLLDSEDVLGVFIEGVLGKFDEAPPVQVAEEGSDLPPAIGFPIPVREDGTISLPLIKPLSVRGLNIQQAEQLITRAYREGDNPILKDDGRILVTLMKERTYRVFVVRQDNLFSQANAQFGRQFANQVVTDRSDRSGRGFVLQMPAYKNDLLNALAETGGMPGLNAKSEVRILRGDRVSIENRDREVDEFYRTNGPDQFPYGVVPPVADESNVVKIPTRVRPGEKLNFTTEDIILRDGDIVYVDTRDTEVYYTGGLLRGGEFPLPRDYDLDVLGAISIAGNGIGAGQGVAQGNFLSGGATVPATELILLRKLPGNRQIAIRVDVTNAINNPQARLLVKPMDTLILRYKPQEELANFSIAAFFTYGIRALFQ
jgi:protein involved in polysaccharide export with SLBB domain